MTKTIQTTQTHELQDCPVCGRSPEVRYRNGYIIIDCKFSLYSKKKGHILSVFGIDVQEAVEEWNALGN